MMMIYGVFAVISILWILSLVILLHARIFSPRSLPSTHGNDKGGKNVLVVVAHPDDESMFFSPTLLSLASLGHYNIRLLCLSSGNAEGLGSLRKQEIISACTLLKVPVENVEVLDDPCLQDGHNQVWSQDLIVQILKKTVATHNINIVITFDGYGVSGHPNHCSVHRGVRAFLFNCAKDVQDQVEMNIEAWQLVSINILRKYCGPFNVLCSIIEKPLVSQGPIHCFYNKQPQRSIAAMKQHATQWLWYRRLFVIFSHYTYMNTLQKIKV